MLDANLSEYSKKRLKFVNPLMAGVHKKVIRT